MSGKGFLAPILIMAVILLASIAAAPALGQDATPVTETISESGYCDNPDNNAAGAVWERTYDLGDVAVSMVEVNLRWSDDEGGNSDPDEFRVSAEDGGGNSSDDRGSNGDLAFTIDMDGMDGTWTLKVELVDAGPTPVGPIGIINRVDPGNSWSLSFTYTYVPRDVEPPEPPGPPPNIAALYEDPLFWTHVVFMISSTYMFGLVGLLAGVAIFFRKRWADDASRWKRALATNRPFRALAVHAWLVFVVAAVPLGMYVAGKAYGWENSWTSFPAVWNPWFYDITNADHISLIVLVLWALPLWLNREQLMASRPHYWLFGRSPFFRRLAAKAPEPMVTDRELAIMYFLMGVFVFLVFMVQPHGN